MDKQSGSSVPHIWKPRAQLTFQRSFELNVDDHLLIDFATTKLPPFWPFVLSMGGLSLFVALIVNYEMFKSGRAVEFAVYVGGAVGACMLLAAVAVRPLQKLWRHYCERKLLRLGQIGVEFDSVIDQFGIYTNRGGQSTKSSWESLFAIEEGEEAFYFWLTPLYAHPWPARLFSSQQERDMFRRQIEDWSGRAVQPPALARLGNSGRQNLPRQN